MCDLTEKIYNDIKQKGKYNFSKDFSAKVLENNALKELEDSNIIIIKTRSIGYVIADVL